MRFAAPLLASLVVAAGCSNEADDASATDNGSGDELLGGTPEARFAAVGYVADTKAPGKALCGATLIAPNVVATAAHCVYRNRDKSLIFGTGELGSATRYSIVSVGYHPDSHMEKQGMIDLIHTLLLNDIAYAILDKPVPGIAPATLPSTKPPAGTTVRLVAYGPGKDDRAIRKGIDGKLFLNVKLGSDTIGEVRPLNGAVCNRDGDEGHAAVSAGTNGVPVLVGLYVGSVTQSFSDCRAYLQYLNGYETTYGHLDFYKAAIAEGAKRLK